jgi:rhodanese-related sulfurtransferase/DNA-binding transcriptional ArsR family regulator
MDKARSMPVRGAPQEPPFDRLAVVGKAFANAKRLHIIELLAQSERSVDELVQLSGLGLSTVSAHLQILRSSALVRTRREGTRVFYRLAGEDVAALFAALGAVARTHSADVEAALEAYLGTGGGVGTVTREEVAVGLADGTVALLDVRPAEEYAAGHIPEAVSLPLEDLLGRARDLPTAPRLVTYCRGAYCVMAHDAVTLLGSLGRDAVRLEDGFLEWRREGRPVASSPTRLEELNHG